MDELETRIAALELLTMELLALADPSIRAALTRIIREGIPAKGEPGHGGDEYTVRQQALTMVDDAELRHVLFTVRKPDA